ncbi:MAG: alpha/beta fold hydrolase [Betaproteobacteria bacterium]|nr:alpha/beta fold hydrolase [Betaproteobacteria bacterium]
MTLTLPNSSPINSTTVRTITRSFSLQARQVLLRVGMGVAARLAPHWTVRTASRLFITPPRFAHPIAEQALLARGLRHHIESSAGRVAAWRFGDAKAPAIIASHGWGGRGAQFHAFVDPLVSAGFQVWLFDHVGHGQSAGREASLVDFAAGVAAVHRHVTARGIEVRGLLSHSLGGAGVATALRGFNGSTPVDAKRVVMIAPPSSLMRYSRIFARHFGLPERIRAAMQWRFEQRYGVAWQSFEMPHAVSPLKAAALVIHDTGDRDVSIESGLAVARAWPDARFRRTHGLGHRRILKSPGVIQDTIDFFTDQVRFSPPPPADEWQSFPGPAPLF